MKAYDVMTKDVFAVSPDTTVSEVARLITEHRIGGVPVVDEDGKVLGIITKRELFIQEQAVPFSTERMPALFNRLISPDELAEKYRELRNVKASEVMNKAVTTVEADEEVGKVAETMMRCRTRRVPVTSDGKLVGIISRSNIINLLVGAERLLDEAEE